MNKAETINAVQTTHDQLVAAIARVPNDLLTQPGVSGEWTVRDIMAHVTFWEQRMLTGFQRLLRHEPVENFTIPDGQNQQMAIDKLNEDNYQANKSRSVSNVRQAFDNSFEQIVAALQGLTDADFDDNSDTAKLLGTSVSEFFAGDSYDHYPEHTEAVTNWLNRQGVGG